MDEVFEVLEEINRWLYKYLGEQWARALDGGSLPGPSMCIVKQGKVLAALFLGGFDSSHLEGFISSYCMHASECENEKFD